MDLIYTNTDRDDVGVLHKYSLDLAFGKEENNFELQMSIDSTEIYAGSFVYIEGTEYGGIVDGIVVDTEQRIVKYTGRSFHGLLNSKVICPAVGEDYYTVTGEANSVLAGLVTLTGLTGLFQASEITSDLTITSYSFDRYTKAYDGISKMLKSIGAKLQITFKQGIIELAAVPITNYAEDEQYSSDHYRFTINKQINKVNHLICLGSGELSARQVLHLYVQEDGSLSTETQFFTGLTERTEVLDMPNAESLEELQKSGMEKLQELNNIDTAELQLVDDDLTLDINDIVGATEEITQTKIINRVIKKIVKIQNNAVTVNYKVGD